MSRRQLSALSILKGRCWWRDKKWRFSVTNAAAPVHSAYAAIKASAGLKPKRSYFRPSSKETNSSSSTGISAVVSSRINSRRSSADRLRFTSSKTVRGMRIRWVEVPAQRLSSSFREALSTEFKAKMNSLESRMKSKLFLPDFFAGSAQGLYCLFPGHPEDGGRIFSDQLPHLFQMHFGFFGLRRHFSTSLEGYHKGSGKQDFFMGR